MGVNQDNIPKLNMQAVWLLNKQSSLILTCVQASGFSCVYNSKQVLLPLEGRPIPYIVQIHPPALRLSLGESLYKP